MGSWEVTLEAIQWLLILTIWWVVQSIIPAIKGLLEMHLPSEEPTDE